METIVVDQLRTLLSQEQRYDLPDYLHAITPGDSGSVSAMEVDRIQQHMEEDPSAKPMRSREGHIESNGRIMNDGILCLSDIQKQKIHWREKICEWSYQVADHFDLNREVVYVALHYVDRCSSMLDGTSLWHGSKDDFQLLSMAALSLAVKLYEHRNIRVPGARSTQETILLLSRGKFTLAELEAKELDVLQRLQWQVHPPTPQTFVGYILQAYFPDVTVRDMATFAVELAVLDYFFVTFKASEIALAGLLQSIGTLLLSASLPATSLDSIRALRAQLVPLQNDRVRACQERLGRLYSSSTAGFGIHEGEIQEDRADSPVSVAHFDHAAVSYNP